MTAAVRELLQRLRALALPTASDRGDRVTQLAVLQIYARQLDKRPLERLSAEQLDEAERQIVENATKFVRDWEACIALLYRAGYRLTLIAEVTGVPLETLRSWYPYAAPDSPTVEPISAPPSDARN